VDHCSPCPAGFYCVVGTVTPQSCSPGYFCSSSSANATACHDGVYCGSEAAVPLPCPSSYYCPAFASTPIPCPGGTFCPPGSSFPLVCSPGSYSPSDTTSTSRAAEAEACVHCPPGTYASGIGGERCPPCPEGYVCLGSTRSPAPRSAVLDGGYPCPPGKPSSHLVEYISHYPLVFICV
jgi:hypothetical protein